MEPREEPMKYVLMIHGDESGWEQLSREEQAAQYQRYDDLAHEMEERGHMRGADQLDGAGTAKLVRVRDGETVIADGPFVETKEQLGGYFVVECDLDTAIDYARRIPAAEGGTVEVRATVEGP
jgi:hypothetical protein